MSAYDDCQATERRSPQNRLFAQGVLTHVNNEVIAFCELSQLNGIHRFTRHWRYVTIPSRSLSSQTLPGGKVISCGGKERQE